MHKIILAGGGHGHINILKNLIKNPLPGFDITLITDNERQYYSGMLAGFIEGIYTADEISFNVKNLCQRAGVTYIEDKILAIDGENQLVKTSSNTYPFNFISINLGSAADLTFPIDSAHITLVKPIGSVVAARDELLAKVDKNDPNFKLAFTGGGAAGVELAIAYREVFPKAEIFIITAHQILANFNPTARGKLFKILKQKNIKVFTNERVLGIKDKIITTTKGSHSFDQAFITTGVKGVDVDYLGYEVTAKNELIVNEKLLADQKSLAMGDMVRIDKYPAMPKAGVFAIREAPILYDNLMNLADPNSSFCSYKPQLKYLQIINCGHKKALANYGDFASYGKLAFMLKDYIDKDYMKV